METLQSVSKILLFHVRFVDALPVEEKIRVLGMAYEDIKNGVTESNVRWSDDFLAPLSPRFLLTQTAERVIESIVQREFEAV